MGAPGSHVWQGQVFAHNLQTDLTNSSSANNPRYEDDSYFGYSLAIGNFSQQIADSKGPKRRKMYDKSGASGKADNYNSTSYDFTNHDAEHRINNKQGHHQYDVAIGVPRGNQLLGKVVMANSKFDIFANLSGEQIGSYFGYSLATVDINGDSLDDLLIGAPFFHNYLDDESYQTSRTEGKTTSPTTGKLNFASYDNGRVYVALQTKAEPGFSLSQIKLDGLKKSRARFGSAMTNCGDLNSDGIDDIAIGAPFDGTDDSDNSGAIYIYNGSRDEQKLINKKVKPDQVIYARSIDSSFKAFGWSLSSKLDVDNNDYPDILIGDYLSSQAVLLRSKPVINVNTKLMIEPEQFNIDEKNCLLQIEKGVSVQVSCINVKYCFNYSGYKVDEKLDFLFDIKLDVSSSNNIQSPRLFFLNTSNSAKNGNKFEDVVVASIKKNTEYCRSFKAYLSNKLKDKLRPIRIDIKYKLEKETTISMETTSNIESPADDHDGEMKSYRFNTIPKLQAVISNTDFGYMSKMISLTKHCGHDNICVPDLVLSMKANVEQFTIESSQQLNLVVSIKNIGEPAFESTFYLIMPQMVNFVNVNKTKYTSDYPICNNNVIKAGGNEFSSSKLNMLICDLGNPINRNEVINFTIITEPAKGYYKSHDFTFLGLVNSSNSEFNKTYEEDNQVLLGIPLNFRIDLKLSGYSLPKVFALNSSSLTKDDIIDASRNKSVKLSEAHVGPEVLHVYKLENKGLTKVSKLKLTILWPSKREDGNHLLYLVDLPFAGPKVKCKTTNKSKYINELNLLYQQDMILAYDDEFNDYSKHHKHSFNNYSSSFNLSQSSHYYTHFYGQQSQRDLEDHQDQNKNIEDGEENNDDDVNKDTKKESSQDTNQKSTFINSLLLSLVPNLKASINYNRNTNNESQQQKQILDSSDTLCKMRRCTKFICQITNLYPNEIQIIKIRSRLYTRNLDSISKDLFDISSMAFAEVKNVLDNVEIPKSSMMVPNDGIVSTKVFTQVYIFGLVIQELFPLWLILMAISLAITIFAAISLYLKSRGFFKRKQIQRRRQKNSIHQNRKLPNDDESNKSTTIWNIDYNYCPGDTAL